MSNSILALNILSDYKHILLNKTNLEKEVLEAAVKQLQDLEHYAHYTCGLWATDRPEAFKEKASDLLFQLNPFKE